MPQTKPTATVSVSSSSSSSLATRPVSVSSSSSSSSATHPVSSSSSSSPAARADPTTRTDEQILACIRPDNWPHNLRLILSKLCLKHTKRTHRDVITRRLRALANVPANRLVQASVSLAGVKRMDLWFRTPEPIRCVRCSSAERKYDQMSSACKQVERMYDKLQEEHERLKVELGCWQERLRDAAHSSCVTGNKLYEAREDIARYKRKIRQLESQVEGKRQRVDDSDEVVEL